MARNKYEFIKELLEDKRLNHDQRKRVLELASKEISIEGNISERLEKVEQALNIINPVKVPDAAVDEAEFQEPKSEENLPKYIYPSNLYKFLFAYNQDPVLKYTCHLIDTDSLNEIKELCGTEVYDYELHHNILTERFKKIEEIHKYAPYRIKALIRGYLTGKDYDGNTIPHWGSEMITFNWANDEIIEWVQQNLCPPNADAGLKESFGNPPNLMLGSVIKSKIIPTNDKSGKEYRIRTFNDLIIYFKYLFHIRSDNSLLNILLAQNKQKEFDKIVSFVIREESFPFNIEFFTDVGKLIQVYNAIIGLILEVNDNQEKPVVELKLKERQEEIQLCIHHRNSTYRKTLQNTLDRIGTSYTNLIRNQINGLCDFYLQADFGGGQYAKINIWDNDFITKGPRKRRVVEKLKYFEGVEHVLIFKKK